MYSQQTSRNPPVAWLRSHEETKRGSSLSYQKTTKWAGVTWYDVHVNHKSGKSTFSPWTGEAITYAWRITVTFSHYCYIASWESSTISALSGIRNTRTSFSDNRNFIHGKSSDSHVFWGLKYTGAPPLPGAGVLYWSRQGQPVSSLVCQVWNVYDRNRAVRPPAPLTLPSTISSCWSYADSSSCSCGAASRGCGGREGRRGHRPGTSDSPVRRRGGQCPPF